MFDAIISWLFDKIGSLLDKVITAACGVNDSQDGLLSLSITHLVKEFPAFSTLYSVLQAIALGLLVLIAGSQIVRFFIGGTERKESPTKVIFGSFVGAGLIYFGNYIVDAMIKLANLPYTALWNANMNTGGSAVTLSNVTERMTGAGGAGAIATGIALDFSGLGIVKTLFQLICLLVIGYNVLKILVEMVQHLFMVGLLTFTSPLAYCTVPSSSTIQVFKKWLNMLVSQLILMSLLAWSLKLILSSLENCVSFGGFLFLLAACKTAQRMDSYVQQLGLNTAATGGGMMEDIKSAASLAIGSFTGGVRPDGAAGANAPALGSNFSPTGNGSMPKEYNPLLYGLAGQTANAIRQGKSAKENGATLSETMQAAKDGFKSKTAALGAFAPKKKDR